MKRYALILVLILLSGLYSLSFAVCLQHYAPAKEKSEIFEGTIDFAGAPCEEGEDCMDCMTLVLITADKTTYYLTTQDQQLIMRLDDISYQDCPAPAKITGTAFVHGSYNYLKVVGLELMKVAASVNATTIQPITATKFLREGQLFIQRGEETYTVTGQEVK